VTVAVQLAHREPVVAVSLAGEHHPAVGQHRVPGRPEPPAGHPDLGVQQHHRLHAGPDFGRPRPAVQVPPAGAVGEEPQRAVRGPPRLADRLGRGHRPARSTRRWPGPTGPSSVASQGNRRVVPAQVGERATVRGQPGRRDEVGPGDQHLGLGRQVGGQPDDLVAHRRRAALGRMPFPDADDRRAVRAHLAVGEAVTPRHRGLGGQRLRGGPGRQAVEPLVGPSS